jgi:hypothetical protein
MHEKLTIIVPQVVWGAFACISGWQGHQMLWAGRMIIGGTHVLVCLAMVALALNWRKTVYYFAPAPLVWKGGVIMLIVLLTTAFLIAGWRNSPAGG